MESANVVGYNTAAITGGQMNLLCVSWETVGNTQGKATLNDVMDISVLTSYDVDEGDYIQTWDMANGNWGPKYFYVDKGTDPDWGSEYANTWMDGNFVPCNPAIDPGSAFWLYANNTIADFKFKGQVSAAGTAYTLTAGCMNLCANPYPAVLNLNDKSQVVLTGMTSYGDEEGDYIQTWDLTTGNWGPKYFYVDQGSNPDWGPEYADTWMNGAYEPVATTAIPAGTGFWYYANAAVTLTFTSPVN